MFKTITLKSRTATGLGIWLLALTISSRAADIPPALAHFLAAQTNLQTWSADLVQTRHLTSLTQTLSSTGHVWFAAPNKFHWEIGTPAQTIAVRGSNEMLIIYPRLKRVEKYPLEGEGMGKWKDTMGLLEAGFPRSQAELEKQFKIVSVTASNDISTVKLEPRSAAARKMMPMISLAFADSDSQLRATELQFGDGSVMRNDFFNAQLNPKLDDAIFAPRIDPDFKVVEPLKAR